jgi:predicted nucleic acid-binding protein
LFRKTGRDRERGNAVPDTHLITLMRQHGVRRVYSRDYALRRFADVEVIDPFAAPLAPDHRARHKT